MAGISSTAWATGSVWRSTKRRSWDTAGQVDSKTGFRSLSSLGSTCPAGAASESRTPSWSARPDQKRSSRPPRNCSCCDGAAAVPDARRRHDVATTNDLKNGMTLSIDGALWSVVEFQHVKPGKGGAFVRTKLKNVLSGKVVDRTFNAGVRVEVANVDKREMQYLYREGDDFVFMDTTDYDQPHIPAAVV